MLEALPSVILAEITSRLALKSIVNCTHVCKLWRTLISNPFLAKSDPTYFVFSDSGSARFAIFDFDHNSPARVIEDNLVWLKQIQNPQHPYIDINILGSCNGLICFSQRAKNEKIIYIYNPTLGETVTVPSPYPENHYYVFGFCLITNQYKLLAISFTYVTKPDVAVYTLGSNQGWRHVHIGDDDPYYISSRCDHLEVCGGGVIYWPYQVYTQAQSILTFNLAVEEFGSVPMPPIGHDKCVSKLAYLDHSLIATTKTHINLNMEIWVWKESSWTMNWALPWAYTDLSFSSYLVPTKIFGDGRILMIDGQRLYLYYLSSTKEALLVNSVVPSRSDYLGPERYWSDLVPYTPTLVSPKELMEGVTLSQNKDMEAPLKRKPKSCFTRLFGSCGMGYAD